MCVRAITQLPLDMTVMRELSVLLTALCSSSRAVIISSIWARFPRPAESGWVLALPILTPAELVPAGHLCTAAVVPSTAGLLFSIQFFRYWLGFSAADTSGDAGGWLRWEWGLKNPAIAKNEKLKDHLELGFVVLTEARPFGWHRCQVSAWERCSAWECLRSCSSRWRLCVYTAPLPLRMHTHFGGIPLNYWLL